MIANSIPAEMINHLRCPNCGGGLEAANGALRCASGHNHNIARQGYVSLFPPGERTPSGDSAQMVAARKEFLAAGHYAPLSDAIIVAATEALRPGFGKSSCIADLAGRPRRHCLREIFEAIFYVLKTGCH